MNRIFVALLTVFVFQDFVPAADKVRIAIPEPNAQFLTLPLAQKKGFLKEEGVETEVILVRSHPQIPALVNGEIDYTTAILHGVRAAVAGLPVKVLACYLPSSTLTLVTRPEVKSFKELKGKTVGTAGVGGAPDVIGAMILKHFGLEAGKDVKFLHAGSNDARLAVLKGGLVDAIIVPPPWEFHARKLGYTVLVRAYDLFSYPQVGLIANNKKIKEKPDEIKRVIKAGIKANRYIRANREGTIQFLMEWQKIDKEIAAATYESIWKALNEDGSLPEKGFHLVLEEVKKAAKVDGEISFNEVADLSILREAQREVGIPRR